MNEPASAIWIRPLLGRADDMRAEVWLRCTPPAAAAAANGPKVVVSGTLVGPECSTAATLPTTVSLVDQGTVEGQPPLARGVCTEPGFWTPELPNLYRAEVTLRRGDDVVASGRRMIGLRRLGVQGRSLSLDGRRYVPRGVACQANPTELDELRQLSAVAVVGFPAVADPAAHPSAAPLEAMLTTADRIGVAVVIRLGVSTGAAVDLNMLQERLEAWAAHPSVFLVTLPSGSAGVAAITSGPRRGTMLFGLEVDGLDPPPPLPDGGVDLLVVRLPEHGLPHGAWQQAPPLPLVAAIEEIDSPPAAMARRACDRLQAALAAWARPERRNHPWDWAGYLVT